MDEGYLAAKPEAPARTMEFTRRRRSSGGGARQEVAKRAEQVKAGKSIEVVRVAETLKTQIPNKT